LLPYLFSLMESEGESSVQPSCLQSQQVLTKLYFSYFYICEIIYVKYSRISFLKKKSLQ
jgi:hypothetical protein